jgi:hypothetical protein
MMEVRADDIDKVDAWDIFYEIGTTDFVVVVGEERFAPVFYYDEVMQPTDFEGWKYAE